MDPTLIADIGLAALLAVTLAHAVRLERALGALRRDRAELEALVAGFDASTRQAEAGAERLRDAADGAGRHVAKQIEAARAVRDDMTYLTERGERLADRLDALVRTARPAVADAPRPAAPRRATMMEPSPAPLAEMAMDDAAPRPRSKAEQDLLRALRLAR